MRKLFFLLFFSSFAIGVMAQTYTSGITATGSGSSTNVRLGGANPLLVNTTVDLGTFTFGFKKTAANYFTILNNGNIGIGTASPTSLLHLKAGTATVNTAPLKFTSGVNLTTPEAGAMEFNGTSLFFTPSATRLEMAFADLSNISGTLGVTRGGTGFTTLATGDILYGSTTNTFGKLAIGSNGQILTITGGVPTWTTPAVAASGWGLTGNAGTNPATNFIGTTDNVGFVFRTNNTEKLRIDSAGNVGIGKINPSYKLDVNGTGRFTSDILVNGMNLGLGAGAVSSNTIFGYQAGQLNTTGTDNSFIGYQAGANNTTGSYNYLFGNQAGINNTTGSYNSFIAYHAGYSNTSGNANNFIGYGAGFTNTTGSYNNFIGSNSGYSNTIGNGNVFISRYTGLNNTTGNYNSYIGYASGSNNTTGSFNGLLGYHAGYYIADGVTPATIFNNSVLIGTETKLQADNQTNQIVIGYSATGDGSNTTVLGNSSMTSTKLFGQLKLPTYGTGAKTGTATYNLATDASGNIIEVATTAGGGSWGLNGNAATVPGTNYIGTSDAQRLVLKTNNIEQLTILSNGNIGVGFSTPGVRFDVSGYIRSDAAIFSPMFLADNYYPNGGNLTWNSAGATPYMKLFNSTGNLLIQNGGTFTDLSSVLFHVASSTKSSMPAPVMTNSEMLAIGSPVAGSMVVNSDSSNRVFSYDGSNWRGYNFGLDDSTLVHKGSNETVWGVKTFTDSLLIGKGVPFSTGRMRDTSSLAIGKYALASTTGALLKNTAIGYQALNLTTTGIGDIAIGYQAQTSGITGSSNISIGNYTLYYNTANFNTAVGHSALGFATTGGRNDAFGLSSLQGITTGTYNAAFGENTRLVNNGSYNSIFGNRAGYNSTGDSSIFFGYQAGYNSTGNGKLYIANTSTSTPLIYGEFQNKLLTFNGNVNITTGSLTGSASAILNIESITKGLKPPVMTNAQMLAITSPASGLIVMNSDSSNRIFSYDGSSWRGYSFSDNSWVRGGNIIDTSSFIGSNNNLPLKIKVGSVSRASVSDSSFSIYNAGALVNRPNIFTIYHGTAGSNVFNIGSNGDGTSAAYTFNTIHPGLPGMTLTSGYNPSLIGNYYTGFKIKFYSATRIYKTYNDDHDIFTVAEEGVTQPVLAVRDIGIYVKDTTTKYPSANLVLGGTTQGALLPRLTNSQMNLIVSPASGLLITNTDSANRLFIYTGSAWKGLKFTDEGGSGSGSGSTTGWGLTGNAGTNSATNFIGTTDNASLAFRTNNTTKLLIDATGNVGIGTQNTADANYKLFVETGIRTRKIKVDALTWSDYVFDNDYKLPTLFEVEKFIQQNKHLPGVQSAAEVEKNGIDLAENSATLLKKIEELTLYMIELNKKVESLAKENELLKEKAAITKQ